MIDFITNFPILLLSLIPKLIALALALTVLLALLASAQCCKKNNKSFLQWVVLFLALVPAILINMIFSSQLFTRISRFVKLTLEGLDPWNSANWEDDAVEWIKDRDTIKCSNCGFGFYPSQFWFRNGQCEKANDPSYRPNFCSNCGKPTTRKKSVPKDALE